LLRRRTTLGLVQVNGLFLRSALRPREAFRLSLVASPRCFEQPLLQLTFCRHEHPRSTPLLETVRRAIVGKPADCDFQGHREAKRCRFYSPHAALDHLAVIQPPTAPCLTARGRLRADWPPRFSVPIGTVGESTAALSAVGRSAKPNPLTPLRRWGGTTSARMPTACARFHPCTSMHWLLLAQGVFHRTRPPRAFQVRVARLLRWPANSALHVFIGARKLD
jgi:hypothetical protein